MNKCIKCNEETQDIMFFNKETREWESICAGCMLKIIKKTDIGGINEYK